MKDFTVIEKVLTVDKTVTDEKYPNGKRGSRGAARAAKSLR